ncbi:hypothetical protein WR25_01295 [Diploscapter pachys]|uniref:Uncharacterized protein n=1 Tax=Diploscapter pachys TaxID=2018661 RepID=A0A2A2J3N2_9BILA|nr:hypothetical protein WR25_01295 [Diploscapter pachys]
MSFESLQTSLPPSVARGWNDPPPINPNAPSTPDSANRLAHMRKRIVDPSINSASAQYGMHQQQAYGSPMQQPDYNQQQQQQYGAGAGMAPLQTGAQQSMNYGMQQTSMPQMQQPQQHSPTSAAYAYQTNPAMGAVGMAPTSMHVSAPQIAPGQAPVSYSQPQMQYGAIQQQPVGYGQMQPQQQQYQQYAQQPQAAAAQPQQTSLFEVERTSTLLNSLNLVPNPISSAIALSEAANDSNKTLASRKSSVLRADTAPQFSIGIGPNKKDEQKPNLAVNSVNSFAVRPKSVNSAVDRPSWPNSTSMVQLQFSTHSPSTSSHGAVTTSSSCSFPPSSNLIFAPPNLVDDSNKSHIGVNFPKKTAGDVSLLGPQLIPFLMKAASRLPEVKCEGVKLRLRQFEQLIAEGDGFSEAFLKKMNFIVDSLDRGSYEEAWQYYEQLTASFPLETSTAWAHGLRLLISELKQGRKKRASSAGFIRHLN